MLLALRPAPGKSLDRLASPGQSSAPMRPILLPFAAALAGAAAAQPPAPRPLAVIDPGHGGSDPGAVSADGRREKDVTLTVALAIRDAVRRSGRVRVALTREDDRTLPLEARVPLARRMGAGLLLSIHADSAPSPQARGATLYTQSVAASDRAAARRAAAENAVAPLVVRRPDAVAALLAELGQRDAVAESARFARLLRREAGALRFHASGRGYADFVVLRTGDIPAVLFELGYLSNPEDSRFMTSPAGRRAIAEAARRAIEIALARRPPG